MRKELEPLVEILAFFSALRNYGYVDRLGNALDEVTAMEAVKDVLRDFHSQCVDRPQKCVEISEGVSIPCPDIKVEALEEAASTFVSLVRGKPSDEVVRVTREIALEALARKAKAASRTCEMEGGGGA
ncbi:MAG: hypothetical protein ABWK01_06350 [Infirmifilum sp.]